LTREADSAHYSILDNTLRESRELHIIFQAPKENLKDPSLKIFRSQGMGKLWKKEKVLVRILSKPQDGLIPEDYHQRGLSTAKRTKKSSQRRLKTFTAFKQLQPSNFHTARDSPISSEPSIIAT
jgi:hypothetical protein